MSIAIALCDCFSSRVFPRAVWWESHTSRWEGRWNLELPNQFHNRTALITSWLSNCFCKQISCEFLFSRLNLHFKWKALVVCSFQTSSTSVTSSDYINTRLTSRWCLSFSMNCFCVETKWKSSRRFSGLDTKESIYGSRLEVPSMSLEHHQSICG